jgi:peptidoglycan hydrolase-like protein with peptidoglycan-binding domain
MPLQSNLFKDSKRLQDCLVRDTAHVTPGSAGDHVKLIQIALQDLDGLTIDTRELQAGQYGTSTAAAVLAFKKKRKIVNRSYQTTEDNIVGKMTITALDKEMFQKQYIPRPGSGICMRPGPVRTG